jgi:glycosyltransferase involved in cell wall biosynthesis
MASLFVIPLMELELKQGYESRIICSKDAINRFGGVVIPFDFNLKNLALLPFVLLKLFRYIFSYKPDIIVSHNFKSSPLPLLVARLLGIPSRIYFNHGVPYVAYKGILRRLLRLIEGINISLATEVITVSQDMKSLLIKVNNQKPISIIANGSACGIELDKYTSNQYDKFDFYAKHGVFENDFIVTYIGRPEVRKGFLVALNIWTKYFQVEKSYKLFLCGPTKESVIESMEAIPENVICLGFAENIPEVLFNTDCLILPSFHEGLSYAVLEAMASGCIVIANDIDGIRNLIVDGINGFLIKGNDSQEYAKKIFSIKHESQTLLSSIREEAIKTANLYSRDIFLAAYKVHLDKIFREEL